MGLAPRISHPPGTPRPGPSRGPTADGVGTPAAPPEARRPRGLSPGRRQLHRVLSGKFVSAAIASPRRTPAPVSAQRPPTSRATQHAPSPPGRHRAADSCIGFCRGVSHFVAIASPRRIQRTRRDAAPARQSHHRPAHTVATASVPGSRLLRGVLSEISRFAALAPPPRAPGARRGARGTSRPAPPTPWGATLPRSRTANLRKATLLRILPALSSSHRQGGPGTPSALRESSEMEREIILRVMLQIRSGHRSS
jgi:hypothetical protein